MKRRLEKVLHRVFQVGIVVKGLDGILEVLGDAMLFMATQPQIARFVGLLTKEELVEDPKDFLASHVAQ
ncbi:MAG: hypothetical protein KGN77_08220 [Xanthomonadaceae bacterium]|nr:hypothetical protein [Xanthomonadaceae bacterium]